METTKSSFLEVMGDYPINRVLDFLMTFDEFDYSLTEIATNSGVGYSTLMLIWPKLEGKGIVVSTRKVGKSRMFMVNKKEPAVQQLMKLHWQIAKQEMHKTLAQEGEVEIEENVS